MNACNIWKQEKENFSGEEKKTVQVTLGAHTYVFFFLAS